MKNLINNEFHTEVHLQVREFNAIQTFTLTSNLEDCISNMFTCSLSNTDCTYPKLLARKFRNAFSLFNTLKWKKSRLYYYYLNHLSFNTLQQ